MIRINSEDFKEWRESLATEIFLQYLKDLSDREANNIKEDFLNGALHSQEMGSIAVVEGKAIAWAEASDIDHEEMENFYAKEREPDEGSEA